MNILRYTLPLLILVGRVGLSAAADKGSSQDSIRYELGPDGGRVPIPKLPIPTVEAKDRLAFALYTTQRGVLKLTAQCYPLQPGEPRELTLEVDNGGWKEIGRAPIDARGHNAVFRVAPWDMTKTVPYRVRLGEVSQFSGTIRRDPVDKAEIVVAAFTGNSNGDRRDKPDVIANLKHQDPDLLFFSGDQSYDEMDHLYAWLLFGRQFHEVLRDRPTICIPDDHDVGQGNIWGEGGKLADTRSGENGGYFFTADYVNEVQRAQTANLPDPYDSTPIRRGITVYYTALSIGGLSLAIIEDRKWKTGPWIVNQAKAALRTSHPGVMDGSVPPDPVALRQLDAPQAELLGRRQLDLLRAWTDDWSGHAQMKCVLTATLFSGATHIRRGKRGGPDLDANGWPQTGRDAAVAALRRARAVHLNGDQHLGSITRYGITDWGDAGYSFCVPSIVNYWTRAWDPLGEPVRRIDGVLPKLGDWYDMLGNKLTMLAYANPLVATAGGPLGEDNKTSSGYGLAKFVLRTRCVTFECWGRFTDVTKPGAKQFPGWPQTVTQDDQDGRKPDGYLPAITLAGAAQPVVSVIRQGDQELLYTVRSATASFRAPVYGAGPFTVRVWDQHAAKAVERRDVQPGDGALELRLP